jgi:hypothetical protein
MDLSFLRPLYARPGPWASVYLDASRDTEGAAVDFDLRWRGLRERLNGQGADDATVQALDRVIHRHETRPGDYGLAAFATHGRVVLAEYLAAPPVKDLAAYAPVPHAMPAVAQRGEEVSWLKVLVNRTGADLDGFRAGRVPRLRRARVRGGENYPIRKVEAGGWAQRRFQREAETAWQHNASDTAIAAVDVAERVGAEVVLVAGDPQARRLLVDELPRRWRDRVVQTDAGSRALGAKDDHLDDATAQAIAEVAEQHTATALDKYGEQRYAGNGLEAVVAALQRGQVDTMLIVDDPSSTERLWIGPAPHEIGIVAADLKAMAVDDPQEVRADAALVRALSGTDADIVLVGPDEAPLDGGLGAVLRYLDASTPGQGNG